MSKQNFDIDPIETSEWKAALDSVIMRDGNPRAEFILEELGRYASLKNIGNKASLQTANK
ncbi:MAG: hypothetical protein HRT87_11210, partial [Legionellales bacterium]|nr:hypothetical protein [Legionellales bacterium]